MHIVKQMHKQMNLLAKPHYCPTHGIYVWSDMTRNI